MAVWKVDPEGILLGSSLATAKYFTGDGTDLYYGDTKIAIGESSYNGYSNSDYFLDNVIRYTPAGNITIQRSTDNSTWSTDSTVDAYKCISTSQRSIAINDTSGRYLKITITSGASGNFVYGKILRQLYYTLATRNYAGALSAISGTPIITLYGIKNSSTSLIPSTVRTEEVTGALRRYSVFHNDIFFGRAASQTIPNSTSSSDTYTESTTPYNTVIIVLDLSNITLPTSSTIILSNISWLGLGSSNKVSNIYNIIQELNNGNIGINGSIERVASSSILATNLNSDLLDGAHLLPFGNSYPTIDTDNSNTTTPTSKSVYQYVATKMATNIPVNIKGYRPYSSLGQLVRDYDVSTSASIFYSEIPSIIYPSNVGASVQFQCSFDIYYNSSSSQRVIKNTISCILGSTFGTVTDCYSTSNGTLLPSGAGYQPTLSIVWDSSKYYIKIDLSSLSYTHGTLFMRFYDIYCFLSSGNQIMIGNDSDANFTVTSSVSVSGTTSSTILNKYSSGLFPLANNTYNIGSSSYKWNSIYSTNVYSNIIGGTISGTAGTFSSNLSVAGNATVTGNNSITGTLTVTNTSTFNSNITTVNIIPKSNNSYNIGSSSNVYNYVYGTNFSGNASTSSKFNSSRTIALTGNITGSVSSDGTSGWTIPTTISNNVVTNAMLVNNKITLGSTNISLGGTTSVINGLTGISSSQVIVSGNTSSPVAYMSYDSVANGIVFNIA